MSQPNPSVATLLEGLLAALRAELSQGHFKNATVSWNDDSEDQTPLDLIWWSWSLSIDPACRILAGAPVETWREIGGLDEDVPAKDLTAECLARFTPAVEQMARSRFGSEVTCSEPERADSPPPEWTSVPLAIAREAGTKISVHFSVSPDLEMALGAPAEDSPKSLEKALTPQAMAASHSADILMHVEMPVSIALGRTKMRMKDLLHLTNGSVVELDQELGDEVEIRVNSCVIAYGEVVAVNGNYAVRILRMAPPRNISDPRGALPERAA